MNGYTKPANASFQHRHNINVEQIKTVGFISHGFEVTSKFYRKIICAASEDHLAHRSGNETLNGAAALHHETYAVLAQNICARTNQTKIKSS